jgi:hypothetical protein
MYYIQNSAVNSFVLGEGVYADIVRLASSLRLVV